MAITDGPLTRLALAWRIERADGAGLALTSHDRPLVLDGIVHEPAPGMTPSATEAAAGLDPQAGEVEGVLSSNALSEFDLALGRWDGAAVSLVAADWGEPDVAGVGLASGQLGAVSCRDGRFHADLLGAAARLERPACPATSPQCRAELGDRHCTVDLAGRRRRARVASQEGQRLRLEAPVGEEFRLGRARLMGGRGCGLSSIILAIDGDELVLRDSWPVAVAADTPIELWEGCDKTIATCAGRFANAANFRGEPHLPGNDLLTRYPGA